MACGLCRIVSRSFLLSFKKDVEQRNYLNLLEYLDSLGEFLFLG